MKLFTDDWRKSIIEQFKEKPKYQKPRIYQIVQERLYSPLLDWIEVRLGEVTLHKPEEFRKRLLNPLTFLAAYHELVTARFFIKSRFTVELEKDFDGITPDSFMASESCKLIGETFTGEPDAYEEFKTPAGDLRGRLSLLSYPYGLNVKTDIPPPEIGMQHTKEIALAISKWLDTGPEIGQENTVHGVTFEVRIIDKTFSQLETWGWELFDAANRDWKKSDVFRLRRNFEKKIKKYKSLARDLDLPLIVCCVTESNSDISIEVVKDAFLGLLCIWNEKMDRLPDGNIDQISGAFSAGLLIQVTAFGFDHFYTHLVLNPNAEVPLPKEVIQQLDANGGIVDLAENGI